MEKAGVVTGYGPDIDVAAWQELSRRLHPADARHPYAMSFVTLERRPA